MKIQVNIAKPPDHKFFFGKKIWIITIANSCFKMEWYDVEALKKRTEQRTKCSNKHLFTGSSNFGWGRTRRVCAHSSRCWQSVRDSSDHPWCVLYYIRFFFLIYWTIQGACKSENWGIERISTSKKKG